ncbi:MAG TPA: YraN family protein [Patescibacteria group bacterium]|nr:YraN family protein [Patescibacteria group bacterium]
MKIASPLARSGEEIATQYLRKLGYKIIDRNFRARNTELDIVAVHKMF